MLTTGLLSLNIHDFSTFEGTELSLHPDLFASLQHGGGGKSTEETNSNLTKGGGSTSSAGGSTISNSPPLSVGDMIEIRVWDPKGLESPHKANNNSLASSTIRSSIKGGSMISQQRNSITAPLPSQPIKSNNVQNVDIQPSSVLPSARAGTSTSSLQYSEASDKNEDAVGSAAGSENDGNDNSTTASSKDRSASGAGAGEVDVGVNNSPPEDNNNNQQPPAKTVTAPSMLPPIFPRPRAGTSDVPTTTATGPSKPMPIHRRVVSSNTTNGAGLSRSPKFGGAGGGIGSYHRRDLSDMTADTAIPHPNLDHLFPSETFDTNDDGTMLSDSVWSKVSLTHKLRLSFVYIVTEKTLTTMRGNARTQISLLRQVADLYNLSSYDTVTVHKIEPRDEEEVLRAVSADFVLFTIKDQFISRGDMHFFQKSLIGTWIYEGERIADGARGIKAHAREIRHGNFSCASGIITDKTMITFRSRSSRIIWLVQLSSEMWDYASPYEHKYQPESICEIYFDQWIRFIYKLFTKWKELEVTHSLTVIFFSRTFVSTGRKSNLDCRDIYGRSYEDHYKPIIEDETCVDWDSLIVKIKEEFIKYPIEVGWNLTDRRPSNANQGNLLEAVNVTLNVMQFHFMDRDLHRTGNSIVVISPGCGVFEVDKGLAGITYQRMMDNGIGSDMLSLGLPPLHIAPFFLYNNVHGTVDKQGVDNSERYYEVPHWMHLSFISYDREETNTGGGKSNPQDDGGLKIKNEWYDFFEIGANGFLHPKVDPNAANAAESKPTSSFSAAGNLAATPGKKKSTQERQLISGRDFRDILEACRPRMSGMRMPSALTSLLRLQQLVMTGESAQTQTKSNQRSTDKAKPLREWGAIDFSEMVLTPPMTRSTRGESPINRRSPSTVGNDGDGSESGSNSSMASHLSSLFGISYDRVLWEQYESPATKKKAIQIQRSPSLEFDTSSHILRKDSDAARSQDSLSLDTDNVSRSSRGKSPDLELEWREENEGDESRASKHAKRVESLRKMMNAMDASSCATVVLKDDDATPEVALQSVESNLNLFGESELSTTPRAGIITQSMRVRSKEKSQGGGLGAALSQYTGSTDTWVPQDGPTSNLLTKRQSLGFLSSMSKPSGPQNSQSQSGRLNKPVSLLASQFQADRARASSPFMPNQPTFFVSSSLGSPSLIPPISNIQQQDLKSPELLRGEEVKPVGTFHSLAAEQKGQQGREGLAFAPGVNHKQSGDLSQPLGLATLSNVDGARNTIKSISRSPPIDSFRVVSKQLSSSPPTIPREKKTHRMNSGMSRNSLASRRKKAFNPFRQSDEDEVLGRKSHNRRRWSHVFPVGEVEFKRHSGPIWNSLTSPAILPLSVDYFPSPHELRDPNTFQFSPYTVTLGGVDRKHYSTHAELIVEMVRQRVTQDFQIVTAAAVEESETRAEVQRQGRNVGKQYRKANINRGGDAFKPSLPTIKLPAGTIKHYLSMGHRIQVLTYDPSSDTIEIVHYNRINAQNDPMNVYTYKFLLYSKSTQKYAPTIQTFKKYAEPYKWNKVDNIICGESDRVLEEGMRFRRVMFGLIPESFNSPEAEQDYVAKFERLVEYLEKLREREDSSESSLDIKIVSTADEPNYKTEDVSKARRGISESMIRFTVQLRKGKRDPFEWIEMAVDSTFDTTRSYRIMFNWLVASSAKVETQIQLLQRRCTQFGLQLISFPQTTVDSNLFLHPFAAPTLICIRNKERADLLEDWLKQRDFVSDGTHLTESQVLECIENSDEYDFPRYRRGGRIRWIPARQYVHRSGTLFIRDIRDRQGWTILAGIENRKLARPGNDLWETTLTLLAEISKFAVSADSGRSRE